MNLKSLTKTDAACLLELIHDATRCADNDQFTALVARLNTLLPFECASALLSKRPGPAEPALLKAVNISYPDEFVKEYLARGYACTDPVVLDNMSSAGLHYWEDSFDRYGRPQPLLDLGHDFGLRKAWKGHGYAYGLTNGSATERGLVSFYGLKREKRTETILCLAVPCLREAMKSIWAPDSREIDLTPREKEILQWCAAGKNSWDVSVILNISKRTVKYHIDNVMQKLDAVNRTHAVAIAMRGKMITLE